MTNRNCQQNEVVDWDFSCQPLATYQCNLSNDCEDKYHPEDGNVLFLELDHTRIDHAVPHKGCCGGYLHCEDGVYFSYEGSCISLLNITNEIEVDQVGLGLENLVNLKVTIYV